MAGDSGFLPAILPAIFLSLVVAKGFGSTVLFKFAVGLSIGALAWRNARAKRWLALSIDFLGLGIAAISWPMVHLHGYWSLLGRSQQGSGIDKLGWSATGSAFLLLWLLQDTVLGAWTVLPVIGLPVFLILIMLLYSRSVWIHHGLVAICILSAIIHATSGYMTRDIQVSTDSSVPPGFAPGPLLARIIGAESVAPGTVNGDVGISSLIFDSEPNRASRRIFLSEHDQPPTKLHTVIRGGTVRQLEPWPANQLFGNQYLLASIAEDGQWASNLGGRLNSVGRILLASNRYHNGRRFEPLIVEIGTDVYINDSDPFVDRLSGYQISTLQEIVRGRVRLRAVNCLFAIGSSLPPSLASVSYLFAIAVWSQEPKVSGTSGDVCLIGPVDWPHEPSRISGVLRSLADSGFPMVRGSRECKIVVVDENRTVRVKPSHRLVLAGPGATVDINDQRIEIDSRPLGTKSGVVDARTLIVDGFYDGVAHRFGPTMIIGTGSPSKQDWGKWLDFSE